MEWGSVTPVYGSVPPQTSVTFTLVASSILLPPGSFGATVIIHTDQPTGTDLNSVIPDEPIPVSDGRQFSIPWNLQVVAAIAFPAQINVSLSPLQAPGTAIVSVAKFNFAGSALVIFPISSVLWMETVGDVYIIPTGSVASFPIRLSYPVCVNGTLATPGALLSGFLDLNCWRADVHAPASNISLTAAQLAAVLNVSASTLPSTPFFSPITLNMVNAAVSTVIGALDATLSTVQLLSPDSISILTNAGIRIRLVVRDAAGFTVQPSVDVIAFIGVQFQSLDLGNITNTFAPATVTSIAASVDNASFVVTAQPQLVGRLQMNVTLHGSLVGLPFIISVTSAGCGANETAANGRTCMCSAGFYYFDSIHCIPCAAGTYKPTVSNEDAAS